MNDLLIEIGCEDLPARYVKPLAQALAGGFVRGLASRKVIVDGSDTVVPMQIAHRAANVFATPRRIAFVLKEVAAKQSDQTVLRLGPKIDAAFKDGQPTPAALGFARSCGVAIEQLKRDNGQLTFHKQQKGRRTLELIPEIFEETLKAMDELVPKRMRWASGNETFVRPVHWIVALFGERVVPIARFGLKAGRKTYGHRFHAPQAIALKAPDEYEAALRAAKVWADFASRRDEIRRQVEAEAAKLDGCARIDEALLEEVTALVEWPVAIAGRIEARFLELPPEVIIATVETNQRYFTVFDAGGKLLPHFITVANIESKDMAQVIAGNERVVRPRLSDALFFWQQDRARPLPSYGEKLATVQFQKELGSVADKVARLRRLADRIVARIGADAGTADRAAELCKNDLVTRMVYEFPELQGLVGGWYARASQEREAVAQAIAEHYCPTQAGGAIPSTREGKIVALADKLDTLAGIFAIGQKPTASKDPFALRRAALGVLRICIEGELDLDLRALLHAALAAQPAGKRDEEVLGQLLEFVNERLRGWCLERGASVEQFEAVRAASDARPLDFMRRLEALRGFDKTEAAAALAAADKRARNILRQAKDSVPRVIATELFEGNAEIALHAQMSSVERALAPLREAHDYPAMLQTLASLKAPVDAFFESVMVMAEDPAVRGNRLALLARLDALCREVADLSCLPG